MIPKFRAWDKKKERMIEWIDLDFSKDNGEDFITVFEPTGIVRDAIISPILLQSTGLFDKNGTEIYEGDIIDKGYCNMSIENRIGYVQFSQGGDSDGWAHGEWLGWITDNHDSLLDVHEHCTVLGNKFEHPHLLEEE